MFVGRAHPSKHGERRSHATKRNRESIEAELNASKRERIAFNCRNGQGSPSRGNDLRALEDDTSYLNLPGQDRCQSGWRVGMSQAVIDRISKFMDALDMVRQGRSDDLPDEFKGDSFADRLTPSCRRRQLGVDCPDARLIRFDDHAANHRSGLVGPCPARP